MKPQALSLQYEPDRFMDAAHLQLVTEAMCDLAHPVKMAVAGWARDELSGSDVANRDRDSTFWEDGWRRCAQRGLLAATVPTDLGGRGLPLAEALLEFEGLGLGCEDNGLAFSVASQAWVVQSALLRAGTDDQRARYLPQLARGELVGSLAITEIESGSDSNSITTRATPVEGGYRIDGAKAYVTNGPNSDFTIVFATLDPSLGQWGITAFLVDHDQPGVRRSDTREKSGLRTTPFCDLEFDAAFVPTDQRMGAEGSGASIFGAILEVERSFLFASQLGLMERQLADTVARASKRQQFGQPIGGFQAVSHRIADMKMRHEAARLLLYKTALLDQSGSTTTLTASLTKLAVTEGSVDNGLAAMSIHGAEGYLSEFGVERDVRDVLGSTIYSGTSDVQRNVIARLIGATS